MQDDDATSFPDADRQYGLPLADAIIAYSDADAIQTLRDAHAACAGIQSTYSLHISAVSGAPARIRASGPPQFEDVATALARLALLFVKRLRSGQLQACRTNELIDPEWKPWRPEDWNWLELEFFLPFPQTCRVASKTRPMELWSSDYVRVREALPAADVLAPAPKAKVSSRSPKGEVLIRTWISDRYREGVRMGRIEWLTAANAATGATVGESRFVRHVLPALQERCPGLVRRGAPPGNSRKSAHPASKLPAVTYKE